MNARLCSLVLKFQTRFLNHQATKIGAMESQEHMHLPRWKNESLSDSMAKTGWGRGTTEWRSTRSGQNRRNPAEGGGGRPLVLQGSCGGVGDERGWKKGQELPLTPFVPLYGVDFTRPEIPIQIWTGNSGCLQYRNSLVFKKLVCKRRSVLRW